MTHSTYSCEVQFVKIRSVAHCLTLSSFMHLLSSNVAAAPLAGLDDFGLVELVHVLMNGIAGFHVQSPC